MQTVSLFILVRIIKTFLWDVGLHIIDGDRAPSTVIIAKKLQRPLMHTGKSFLWDVVV